MLKSYSNGNPQLVVDAARARERTLQGLFRINNEADYKTSMRDGFRLPYARSAVGGRCADRAAADAKARAADLWACGQRKGVAHMPTGPTAAAKSSLIR